MTIETASTIDPFVDNEETATLELPDPVEQNIYTIETAEGRNLQRGLFAGLAVKAYAERVGTKREAIDLTISDLLGDLRHLCDATGQDFAALSDRGYNHYQAEIGGEG